MTFKDLTQLDKEIEESTSENCIEHDRSNKWRPLICRLCGNNYTSRGIDRHLHQAHGITRFDFGVREATRNQTKEIIEMIEEDVMFKDPTEALSMSTLVFNQFVRDLLLNKLRGNGK